MNDGLFSIFKCGHETVYTDKLKSLMLFWTFALRSANIKRPYAR